ncbi:GAF domain-containing sensor histidine kinase [Actinomadura keratinilytica]
MMLPLVSDDRVLGALVTPRSVGARHFTETERTLATQFATQAALALRMAEAQRDRERLAVLEDRDRIARDLHDLVIQRLFATGMMLETAQRRSDAPAVREKLGNAVDELDVTIQEIRTAIFALQQGPADAPAGLRTRVLREINLAAVPLGFTPSHRFLGPVDTLVGETTGKNLVAALREALSNAFRHSGAGRIEVIVEAGRPCPTARRASASPSPTTGSASRPRTPQRPAQPQAARRIPRRLQLVRPRHRRKRRRHLRRLGGRPRRCGPARTHPVQRYAPAPYGARRPSPVRVR